MLFRSVGRREKRKGRRKGRKEKGEERKEKREERGNERNVEKGRVVEIELDTITHEHTIQHPQSMHIQYYPSPIAVSLSLCVSLCHACSLTYPLLSSFDFSTFLFPFLVCAFMLLLFPSISLHCLLFHFFLSTLILFLFLFLYLHRI